MPYRRIRAAPCFFVEKKGPDGRQKSKLEVDVETGEEVRRPQWRLCEDMRKDALNDWTSMGADLSRGSRFAFDDVTVQCRMGVELQARL